MMVQQSSYTFTLRCSRLAALTIISSTSVHLSPTLNPILMSAPRKTSLPPGTIGYFVRSPSLSLTGLQHEESVQEDKRVNYDNSRHRGNRKSLGGFQIRTRYEYRKLVFDFCCAVFSRGHNNRPCAKEALCLSWDCVEPPFA